MKCSVSFLAFVLQYSCICVSSVMQKLCSSDPEVYVVFSYRYLVNLGCIKPLCDLLTVMDSKIVQVALNGLENILRLGEQEAKQENNGTGVNPYCSLIEEAYGTTYNITQMYTAQITYSQNESKSS